MKSNTHPIWFANAKVTCTCGNVFETGSTQETLQVDICNACHPFYTGEMKFIDIQGRVEKFQAKQKQAESYAKVKDQKIKKASKKQQEAALSLKEVLTQMKHQNQETSASNPSTQKN
jgi:large subunit ribosomal protein L31